MKQLTKEDFDGIEIKGKVVSPHALKAQQLIDQFLLSDADVVEIEETDFDNEFDFSNKADFRKATDYLRNVTYRIAYKKDDVCVKARANRLFLARRSIFPDRRMWF